MALLLVLLIPKASARTPMQSCYTILVSCLVDLILMDKYLIKFIWLNFMPSGWYFIRIVSQFQLH